MLIEIKQLKFRYISQAGGYTFTARLVIGGVDAGTAYRNNQGDVLKIFPLNDQGRRIIEEAKHDFEAEFAESSADKPAPDSRHFSDHIDNLIRQEIEKRELNHFRQELRKEEKRGIIIGIPDQSFQLLEFRLPIIMILNLKNGKAFIADVIKAKVIPALRDGKIMLNTNIPEDILKAAGLSDKQYVPPKKVRAKAQNKITKYRRGRK